MSERSLAVRLQALLVCVAVSTPMALAAEPVVSGHRGTGIKSDDNPFPENTLPSFEQAELEGARSVELDVLLAADGALVVMHDDTVDRTTDGTGCVGSLSLADLKQLDAADGTSLAATGVEVPTLGEVIERVSVDINVEIKVSDGGGCPATERPALAQAVVDAIGDDVKDREIIVSSFDQQVLELVKEREPQRWAGLISINPDDLALASDAGLDAIHLFTLLVQEPAVVDAAHELGLAVAVWTENDPSRVGPLAQAGVDTIITDEPESIVASIAELPRGGGGCSSAPSGSGGALLLLAALFIRRRRNAGRCRECRRQSARPWLARVRGS